MPSFSLPPWRVASLTALAPLLALSLALCALAIGGCRAILPIDGPGEAPSVDGGESQDAGDAGPEQDAEVDAGGPSCAEGSADCNADSADGCETDLQRDPAHCGACESACASGEGCAAGSCVPDLLALEAGGDFSCALRTDGQLLCWGAGVAGELGEPSLVDQPSPVSPTGVTGAQAIALGRRHACALRARGEVLCWGENLSGQLGDGSSGPTSPPVTVMLDLSAPEAAVELTAGGAHTCARTNAGRVFCWGADPFGQLGNGAAVPAVPTPVQVAGLGSTAELGPAVQISAGDQFTCARVSGGRAYCWGDNRSGQLGDGGFGQRSMPSQPVSLLEDVVHIEAGANHACALRGSGQVACWGTNSNGELGDGTNLSPRPIPTLLPTLDGVRSIAARLSHTCAVREDGGLLCWGLNARGGLGDGSTAPRSLPTAPLELGPVSRVTVGNHHTCALDTAGQIQCWGDDRRGQLGSGEIGTSVVPRPREVSGLSSIVEVDLGDEHSCARGAAGAVFCWGSNAQGRLGVADPSILRDRPVRLTGLAEATDIAVGDQHSCALLADQILCWGNNNDSQLGHPSTDPPLSDVPIAIGATLDATGLIAGFRHTCALLGDATVSCWGWMNGGLPEPEVMTGSIGDISATDAQGQRGCALSPSLGDGQMRCWNSRRNDTFGGFGSDLTRLAVGGGGHICALRRADGSVQCRGTGSFGQLGNGRPTCQLDVSPIDSCPAVSGLFGIAQITAGGDHSCALSEDGSVWCWGRNSSGQLGDGSLSDQGAPVSIPEVGGAAQVASGGNHTCAIVGDPSAGGGVYCWGNNSAGQAGAPPELRPFPRAMASSVL